MNQSSKYLSDYHKFCDTLFKSHWFDEYHPDLYCAILDNCHKLDVLHCIDGFCGEVLELVEQEEKMEDAETPEEYQHLYNEACQEVGDLLFYMTQLQTLLRIHCGQSLSISRHVGWGCIVQESLSAVEVKVLIPKLLGISEWPELNQSFDVSFSWFATKFVEQILNLTKKRIHYGHEVDFNDIFARMNLLINGARHTFLRDFCVESDDQRVLTLDQFRQLNVQKLKKRHPTGKFTPEAAEAKVDQNHE